MIAAGAWKAPALSWDELLAAATARDTSLPILAIAASRAEIALDRSRLAATAPSLEASSGSAELGFASSGLLVSASPELSYTEARGPSLKLGLPCSIGAFSTSLTPGLSLSYPIILQGDSRLAALASAEASLRGAKSAQRLRGAEIEKELATELKAAFEARAARESARREVEKARSSLEKARRVDGAEEGGSVALSLERALRVQERKERDAAAGLERAAQKIAITCGLETPRDADAAAGLLPTALPGIDLEAIGLPSPASLGAVRKTEDEVATARVVANEAAKTKGLSVSAKAAYSKTTSLLYPSTDTKAADLTAGLDVTLADLDLSIGLGYRADFLHTGSDSSAGPLATVTASWKPNRKADSALAAEDSRLAIKEAEARAFAARREAESSIRDLEQRRADLVAARDDLAEDLTFAESERKIYDSWREKGAVSDADYEEVLAFEAEAQARVLSAGLDSIIWKLDLALLDPAAPDSADAPKDKP